MNAQKTQRKSYPRETATNLDEMLEAMSEEKAHQLREEEREPDANYDPVLRWKHIQETITWAQQNLPPHFATQSPGQSHRGRTVEECEAGKLKHKATKETKSIVLRFLLFQFQEIIPRLRSIASIALSIWCWASGLVTSSSCESASFSFFGSPVLVLGSSVWSAVSTA